MDFPEAAQPQGRSEARGDGVGILVALLRAASVCCGSGSCCWRGLVRGGWRRALHRGHGGSRVPQQSQVHQLVHVLLGNAHAGGQHIGHRAFAVEQDERGALARRQPHRPVLQDLLAHLGLHENHGVVLSVSRSEWFPALQ